MKLTDLRNELNTRAESTDETPDLLSGVHHKITRTKRRRKAGAAGAVGGLAVIAAFAFGILPGLTTTTPQPADDVPKDYVKDGLTLPASDGTDKLEKGFIGDLGQSVLDFNWTPKGRSVRFAGICRTDATAMRNFAVEVNGHFVGTSDCRTDQDTAGTGFIVSADSTRWLTMPLDQPAHVVVRLADEKYRPVQDAGTQIAVGIYQVTETVVLGPPTQAPPTSSDDYVKDGVRYRAKVGGDTLVGAKVGDQGQSSLEFEFTAPGGPISLHDFCTASVPGIDPQYQLSIKLDGVRLGGSSCAEGSIDAVQGTSFIPGATPPTAGQRVKVTVQLEDKNGRAVSRPGDWIGVGIYAKGQQRTVDTLNLDEVIEYSGRNYRLTELKTAPFSSATTVELKTPANTPFVVSYGSSGEANEKTMIRISGLTGESSNSAGGVGATGEAAVDVARTAKLTIEGPRPKTGHLVLALYLPE